ncbi:unnamed protein product [Pleuronectes platessa]|uniref:Uncharacterized protein n=1 Tax=Pleuronectes platessa TaxID=8262 RepID=A0A9N7VWM7_PLEPL|nr:unnamed protein product [Pleuronectes platessa]
MSVMSVGSVSVSNASGEPGVIYQSELGGATGRTKLQPTPEPNPHRCLPANRQLLLTCTPLGPAAPAAQEPGVEAPPHRGPVDEKSCAVNISTGRVCLWFHWMFVEVTPCGDESWFSPRSRVPHTPGAQAGACVSLWHPTQAAMCSVNDEFVGSRLRSRGCEDTVVCSAAGKTSKREEEDERDGDARRQFGSEPSPVGTSHSIQRGRKASVLVTMPTASSLICPTAPFSKFNLRQIHDNNPGDCCSESGRRRGSSFSQRQEGCYTEDEMKLHSADSGSAGAELEMKT